MSSVLRRPTEADIAFMRTLEDEFKARTGFKSRSHFKIFYGPVWRAQILVLGINPAGNASEIAPDGVHYMGGEHKHRASSSSGYFENAEHDVLDCTWAENVGLLKLLRPLLGSDLSIREQVVKTNLAFVRLSNTKERKAIERSQEDSAPFLRSIMERVLPDLILLAGVQLGDFGKLHCAQVIELSKREQVDSVNQPVIHPVRVRLLGGHTCIAVQVAHASQFSWIYQKFNVPGRLNTLMQQGWEGDAAGNAKVDHNDRGPTSLRSIGSETADRQKRPSRIGAEDTKRILRTLVELGLDDTTYRTYLHHKGHTIAKMLAYTVAEYKPGSPNLLLHEKLAKLLAIFTKRRQAGEIVSLNALAKELWP